MSKVLATYDGFVGLESVPVLLAAGDEYDSDHPLVVARPELFTKSKSKPEPEPEPEPRPESRRPTARGRTAKDTDG